jgi:uncharacterized protein
MSFEELLALSLSGATGLARTSRDHGPAHWRRVARNGRMLAAATPGADRDVVRAFAALHDSQRLHEYEDPFHGPRAAAYTLTLRTQLGLTDAQLQLLVHAIRVHNGSGPVDDPTVGVCLDADRLDLPRVGIRPRADLLSTTAAKAAVATPAECAAGAPAR